MKAITRFSVKYPVTVIMIFLAVTLLGVISFGKLGMDLFPNLNNPRIYIALTVGERPPEEMEDQFVTSIESTAIQQRNAVGVSSVSRAGSAQITVEYAWETDMDEAYLDLQKALSSYASNSEVEELLISQYDPNATPILILGLSNPEIDDMDELRRIAESYLRNELVRLEGIADVRLLGQEEKQVVISTDNYLMSAFGLTPSTIANRITEYNRNISGGSLVEMGTSYIITGVGEFDSIDDIESIIVAYQTSQTTGTTTSSGTSTAGRAPVYLKDVATVSLQNKRPDNIVRLDGTRCVALAVYKETRYNTINTVNDFFAHLETLRNALPGYDLTVIQNQGEFITTAIDEVQQALLVGILLAMLVLFIFLRRVGATLIISIAIPLSIMATFNMMYFKGLTLNIMTLGGLALGAGMLVDNAIVVMENITRTLDSGASRADAAVDGGAEVGGAITASTLTTIVVFLPIVYLHGSAGELFKDQAWTVAFALLSSLLVALMVIPMLSARILKPSKKKAVVVPTVRFPRYRRFLSGMLDHRWSIIILAVLLVAGSVLLIPKIGSEFIPRTNIQRYTVDLTLPEGTDLYRTERVTENVEQKINETFGDDIAMLFSIIGPSGDIESTAGTLADENSASIRLVIDQKSPLSTSTVFTMMNNILADLPDVESRFTQEQAALSLTIGEDTPPMVVQISGEDLETLQSLSEQAAAEMASIPGVFNIETGFAEGRPQVDVVLDRVRAGLYNIGVSTVASQLTTELSGVSAGQWDNNGELQDITIEIPSIGLRRLDEIEIASSGTNIPLFEISDINVTRANREIKRVNQERVGEVNAQLSGDRPLDQVVDDITAIMDQLDLPLNYSYQIGGEEQERRNAFANLKFALLLSLVLVYMVLASQFESLIHPFTIILSIPLAAVGAFLMFFFIGKSLNIMAYIGIIMLVGIAVNDSIILVDAINQLKQRGMDTKDAILEAAQRRIRPIIMTSLTTILGLLPLTFGFGEGAELRAPMAYAVIGGLVTSTLLTLVVIPCVYSVLESFSRLMGSLFSFGGGDTTI